MFSVASALTKRWGGATENMRTTLSRSHQTRTGENPRRFLQASVRAQINAAGGNRKRSLTLSTRIVFASPYRGLLQQIRSSSPFFALVMMMHGAMPELRSARLAQGLPEHPIKVTVTRSGRLSPDSAFFLRVIQRSSSSVRRPYPFLRFLLR